MSEEQVFEQLKQIEENRACFECGTTPTAWASVSFGLFLCIKCAGLHRSIGVNISFVRSLNLDTWKPRHLHLMKIGGNKRAKEFFLQSNAKPELSIYDTQLMLKQLEQFYASQIAQDYKSMLKREVDSVLGTEPTPDYSHPLPSQVPKKYANATAISSDEFFGNGRLKKEETNKSCCCTIL